jgi:tRNA A-37 threonylcarbamoyl transferase component Bud32
MKIEIVEEIKEGFRHNVYKVRLENKKYGILKLYKNEWPDKVKRCVNELTAYSIFEDEINLPKIIDYKISPSKTYLLLEYIEGITLSEKLKVGACDDLLANSAKILYKIHSTKEQIGDVVDGTHFLSEITENINHMSTSTEKVILKQLISKMEKTLLKIFENSSFSLTHGDFKPSNLIVKNGEIYVVDWENFCYSIPYLDLLEFYKLPEQYSSKFLNEYESMHGSKVKKFLLDVLLDAYWIRNSTEYFIFENIYNFSDLQKETIRKNISNILKTLQNKYKVSI